MGAVELGIWGLLIVCLLVVQSILLFFNLAFSWHILSCSTGGRSVESSLIAILLLSSILYLLKIFSLVQQVGEQAATYGEECSACGRQNLFVKLKLEFVQDLDIWFWCKQYFYIGVKVKIRLRFEYLLLCQAILASWSSSSAFVICRHPRIPYVSYNLPGWRDPQEASIS